MIVLQVNEYIFTNGKRNKRILRQYDDNCRRITGLLTNYYEYADNIRNLPVKELMRRQGEKTF